MGIMTRVLVTGASGFIGSHALEGFRRAGYDVAGMVRETSNRARIEEAADGQPFELRIGTLDDGESLERAVSGVDVVVHIAGVSASLGRDGFMRGNVGGTIRLLEAMRSEGAAKRLVYVSSLMAAGPNCDGMLLREEHSVTPSGSHYGESKIESEHAVHRAMRNAELEQAIIVRPPLVYGPRDEDCYHMIRSAKQGVIAHSTLKPAPYSFIHVEDLVDGLVLTVKKGRGLPARGSDHVLSGGGLPAGSAAPKPNPDPGEGIYYFADGEPGTLTSFGRQAAKSCGARAVAIRIPSAGVLAVGAANSLWGKIRGKTPPLTLDKARASCAPGWACDDRRAREELGYSPKWNLADGMDQTVAWYRERGRL